MHATGVYSFSNSLGQLFMSAIDSCKFAHQLNGDVMTDCLKAPIPFMHSNGL